MIPIPCPKCGKPVSFQPPWVTQYSDPNGRCAACGYKGKVSWKSTVKRKSLDKS